LNAKRSLEISVKGDDEEEGVTHVRDVLSAEAVRT